MIKWLQDIKVDAEESPNFTTTATTACCRSA